MAWKKIVEVVAVSACPVCGNAGFDFEPGADIDDPEALIKCGEYGHACQIGKFSNRVPDPKKDQS